MKQLIIALVISLFAAAPVSAAVQLSWQDNSDNESGFRIYRSLGVNAPYEAVADAPINATTFVDPDGAIGNCYRVSGFNDGGESQPSNTFCLLPQAPVKPSGLTGNLQP